MTLKLLTLAPLLVLIAMPAQASDEPLDEITVLATRRPATVEEVSAAVSTIDSEELTSHKLTTDALPGETIDGTITAINPQVDSTTRNVRVQATVANTRERLRPGMFVNAAVVLPEAQTVLTIPATAVLYAPYSDSVFIVESTSGQKGEPSGHVLRQQFVRLGKKRGDFIVVQSGLKEGDTIVSTGVFKFRNGQAVVVDNALAPEFNLAPRPADA